MQKDNRGSLYKDYDEMEKLSKEQVEKLKGKKDWYKCYLSDRVKRNDKELEGEK